jgi:hypothetical protein
MDRKKQLGNVAFGGDWSEQILVRERTQKALAILTQAVEDCSEEDARRKDVVTEVAYLCGRIARGELMMQSWCHAAGLVNQGRRAQTLAKVLHSIRSGVGVAGQVK